MEEDDIINNEFIINPREGAGLSGIATSAEPLLAQGSQLADIQEIEPGAFVDRTSVTSVNDLFNYYYGGMPSQQPVTETPAVEADAVVTPAVDTGVQDQATGDLTDNTQFEQNLIDQGAGVQIAPGQPVVAPGEVPVTQQEIDEYNLNTEFENYLIDQGVGIQTEPGAPVGAQGERFDQSPQDYAASQYGLDYDSLDQEEQAIIDQELNPTPEIEPAKSLVDYLPTVQIIKAVKDAYDDATAPSLSETIDFDTYADPGIDAEENQLTVGTNLQTTDTLDITEDPIPEIEPYADPDEITEGLTFQTPAEQIYEADVEAGLATESIFDEPALTPAPAPAPAPAPVYYDSGNGDSGGGGGSSSSSTAGDAPGYSGPSPFKEGGFVKKHAKR